MGGQESTDIHRLECDLPYTYGANHADNDDQGPNGTCVRYALAKAIVEQCYNSTALKLEFDQEAIVVSLMQSLRHAAGTYVEKFKESTVTCQNKIDKKWYTFDVVIQRKCSNFDPPPTAASFDLVTNVICYKTNTVHKGEYHGYHCVYLDRFDKKKNSWIGLNSWGDHDPTPSIPLNGCNVLIYEVRVCDMRKLSGS